MSKTHLLLLSVALLGCSGRLDTESADAKGADSSDLRRRRPPAVDMATAPTPSTPNPVLALSATTLDFGSITLGQTSADQTLTLTNTGTADYIISNVVLSGSSFNWGAPGGCQLNVNYAPGSGCVMHVSFAPSATGVLTGTIAITDNAGGSPRVVALSGTGAGNTSTTNMPAAGLFLGLSFQGLQLNDFVRPYGTGAWCDIVGTDTVYGLTSPRYPSSLWGGTAAYPDSIQLIYNSPGDETRQIVTDTTVPSGVSNQVLQFTFVSPYVSPEQNNFVIHTDTSTPEGMVYFSKWMWLQPDLASRGPFWMELHETKTSGASVGGGNLNTERFAVEIDSTQWTNNQPVWVMTHDVWVQGAYNVYAEPILSPSASFGPMVPGQTSYAPVPLGQWFRVESAWNRNMNGTGWIWMALTVPGSSDPNLRKGAQVFAQSGALDFSWGGVTNAVGWNKSTSDPIDRVYPFGGYSDLARSSTSTYSTRQTNIEVWSKWPSTASPHPASFQ